MGTMGGYSDDIIQGTSRYDVQIEKLDFSVTQSNLEVYTEYYLVQVREVYKACY